MTVANHRKNLSCDIRRILSNNSRQEIVRAHDIEDRYHNQEKFMLNEISDKIYLGNTVLEYTTCAGMILLGLILIFLFNRVFDKNQKYIFYVTDKLTGIIKEIKIQKYITPLLFVIVTYASIKTTLILGGKIKQAVYILFLIAVTYFGLRLLSAAVRASLISYFKRREKDYHEVEHKVNGISTFNNIVIWILGSIFLISNIGFDISAVITGLGISGIALALASQNILRDVFNYFIIFFDQPFQIGDFISLSNISGTIEKIGIKSTRITSLSGEEIIIPNSDLANAQVHNYKNMEKRRIVFTLTVVYQITHEQLESIPGIIKAIIDKTECAEFDRAHFQSYGDSGIIIEIVYFVLSSNPNIYMDTQQKINLSIFKEFGERGIEFAYPTSKIYVRDERKPGL
jgi:small-conductance mechanosensitive channel